MEKFQPLDYLTFLAQNQAIIFTCNTMVNSNQIYDKENLTKIRSRFVEIYILKNY